MPLAFAVSLAFMSWPRCCSNCFWHSRNSTLSGSRGRGSGILITAFTVPGCGAHHHHAVRQIHRLRDIVRHVDHRLAGFPPHVGEQPLHVVARQRVERRERLVHQQHRRIVGQRAGDGDPLLHAAGQMVRERAGELLQLDQAQLFARDFLAFLLGNALHFQPERDVAERGAPRKQLGEILEHHAAVHAVAGHRLAADADLARGRRQESGDHVEQRGFAAAGRADDAEKLGSVDIEADVLDPRHFAAGRVVDQRHVANFDRGHGLSRCGRGRYYTSA